MCLPVCVLGRNFKDCMYEGVKSMRHCMFLNQSISVCICIIYIKCNVWPCKVTVKKEKNKKKVDSSDNLEAKGSAKFH